MTTWEIKGREAVNCTCDYGCPCQFNALPTKGHCHAVITIQIDEGRHGRTKLDGVRFVTVYKWPGAVHEGNGEAYYIIDETASAKQREAILRILAGEDTQPFATAFAVYASTLSRVYDPVFAKIEFEIDVDARTAHSVVRGQIESKAEPLRNKATGVESRAQIVLPNGFEFTVAEVASATSKSKGPVKVSMKDSHAHFAHLHMTDRGVVRA